MPYSIKLANPGAKQLSLGEYKQNIAVLFHSTNDEPKGIPFNSNSGLRTIENKPKLFRLLDDLKIETVPYSTVINAEADGTAFSFLEGEFLSNDGMVYPYDNNDRLLAEIYKHFVDKIDGVYTKSSGQTFSLEAAPLIQGSSSLFENPTHIPQHVIDSCMSDIYTLFSFLGIHVGKVTYQYEGGHFAYIKNVSVSCNPKLKEMYKEVLRLLDSGKRYPTPSI